MNKLFRYFVLVSFGGISLTSCKKDEIPPEVNNYYTTNDTGPVNLKPLMEYGSTDSTSKLTFSYYNGEAKKLEELVSYSGGVASLKIVISYDVSGNPINYQSFTLPANTINAQGNFSLDGNGNITQVLSKNSTGDTTAITTYSYLFVAGLYKIASKTYLNFSLGVNQYFDYFDYDNKGFMTKVTGYRNTTGTLYKRYVTDCTPSNVINPFPNLSNYLLILSGGGNLRGGACLYFSNYVPNGSRTEQFDVTGSLVSATVENYTNLKTDGDNHLTEFSNGFSSIYFKY